MRRTGLFIVAIFLLAGCATTGTKLSIDPGTTVHIEWRQGGVPKEVDLPAANACIIIKPREEGCRVTN